MPVAVGFVTGSLVSGILVEVGELGAAFVGAGFVVEPFDFSATGTSAGFNGDAVALDDFLSALTAL